MKKTRKRKRISNKRSLHPVWFVVVTTTVIMALIGFFALQQTRKQKDILLSLQKEYQSIVEQEDQFLKSGEVLSGSEPELRDGRKKVNEKKIKLPIILYHYVEVVKDENDTIRKSLNINPYVFERQLRDLRDNGYQTYYVKDIPDIVSGKMKISTRSAALTFDDGYEDFYTDAFPLLKKYKIKSTLYMVHDFIGRKGFMSKKQLSELVRSNLVEIGSHAVDHISLRGVTPKQAKFQIAESKDLLEESLGIEIKTFAYPYGGYTDDVITQVKNKRYTAAVTVVPGSFYSSDDLYSLPRYRAGMFGDSMVKVLESLKK